MSELYIGLMSGTSADGIDAALVDFSQPAPNLVATHYVPYPSDMRNEILALCQPGADEINRLGQLDIRLGKAFALTVNELLQQARLSPEKIKAIGSHGQTVRHHPAQQFTLQICDPNIIAAETGITTIADFRRRDIALGGQGAPLVPAFHQAVFSDTNHSRMIVNIGGIANITLLSPNGNVLGFDTGPGNTLLDAWTEIHLKKSYDAHGEWAKQGNILPELLAKLLDDSFFKLAPPKSTGREYFNLKWLQSFLSADFKAEDIQATLVELTARSILSHLPNQSCDIVICGGGAHNLLLMSRLQSLAAPHPVFSSAKLGINPDWVEAMAFAWLAKQTLHKKPGNLMQVTGAKTSAILGAVYF